MNPSVVGAPRRRLQLCAVGHRQRPMPPTYPSTLQRYVFPGCVAAVCLAFAVLHADELSPGRSSTAGGRMVVSGDFEEANLEGWSLVSEGEAEGLLRLDTAQHRDGESTQALRLTVEQPGDRCGIAYASETGINVQAGYWYDLSFFARTEQRENGRGYGLTVSFESPDGRTVCGRTTLPEVGGEWAPYTLALAPYRSHDNVRLVISMSEPGTIWFDDLVLTERTPAKEK